mmetsp:Transcript_16118/g.23836  ORF Transcript_16118/g.23836 Transcript_16118/m.23836 type:complete len:103 (-) Transcript_16118:52-360(-)
MLLVEERHTAANVAAQSCSMMETSKKEDPVSAAYECPPHSHKKERQESETPGKLRAAFHHPAQRFGNGKPHKDSEHARPSQVTLATPAPASVAPDSLDLQVG